MNKIEIKLKKKKKIGNILKKYKYIKVKGAKFIKNIDVTEKWKSQWFK